VRFSCVSFPGPAAMPAAFEYLYRQNPCDGLTAPGGDGDAISGEVGGE